jgi:hypothetical protein
LSAPRRGPSSGGWGTHGEDNMIGGGGGAAFYIVW